MTPHVLDDLDLYAAGWLEPEERASVERHLQGCDQCRAALVPAERTVWALAEAATRPAPAALRDRIVQGHVRRKGWSLPRLALAAVAACAALVVVAIGSGGGVLGLDAAAGVSGRAALVVAPGGNAYLLLAMPTPPADKAYEAWVIHEGVPIPAAVAASGNGLVLLPLSTAPRTGDIAAVTLESAGGTARPTSGPLMLRKL